LSIFTVALVVLLLIFLCRETMFYVDHMLNDVELNSVLFWVVFICGTLFFNVHRQQKCVATVAFYCSNSNFILMSLLIGRLIFGRYPYLVFVPFISLISFCFRFYVNSLLIFSYFFINMIVDCIFALRVNFVHTLSLELIKHLTKDW